MNHYELSPEARADLAETYQFLSQFSAAAADRILDQISKRFRLLADFPEAGRSRDELAPDIRSFPVNEYIILYRIAVFGVEIVRVVHGKRKLEDML